ncbi:MAG: 2-succinyl-5-enolpyruvyl-6-hydroxy-3-cyclohexene-1-carboxylic-acid synthase [Dehalococcoidia bacterium]|nr:2-succinyl-5-enolpyruvyl-6-hydroxy-3-cyclohexene-1-carboxylic-acid synthase [Dehalococcoidia bacterium]
MPTETDRLVRGFTVQLRHSGVSHVIICPGSRSAPLTLAFTRDPAFRCWLHLDERSAGYFALGLARQLGAPVALLCTSGTAAANFLPAVVEGSLSRQPLVVITADRPPELRENGAAQTIDQLRLYGSHVRWAAELPLADGSEALERHARATAARAVELALGPPAGPVHLNFPFREPLVGPRIPEPAIETMEPVTRAPQPPPEAALAQLARELPGRRGLIVCGPQSPALPARAIAALAAALAWPVLADPLSGLRVGQHDLSAVVESYDALVRDPEFTAGARPQVVLRFGAAPTSKPLNGWLAALPEARQYVVDVAGGWRDPDVTATAMLRADPAALCAALLPRLDGAARPDPAWGARWSAANQAARGALRAALDALDEPFEGRAPVELAAALPEGSTLVAGNSMAVRDVDSFLPALARDLRIEGTRGASGIDGVVSSAAGAAAARGGPVGLLIGDLSFFHDLNGLWPLRRYGLDLVVLLVHNNGGGIFNFLPQAEVAPDQFEPWFGTPHGLDFRGAVEMHGGRFEHLEGSGGWREPIARAVAAGGLTVLELRTERTRNVELHREVQRRVQEAVRGCAEARA